MFRLTLSVCLSVMFLGLSGCGSSSDELPRTRVSGEVTLDGQPLESGQISFVPVAGDAPSSGTAIQAGRFSADVPAGSMRVEIRSPKVTGSRKAYDTSDSPMIDTIEEQVPARYNTQSELTLNVVAGENQSDVTYALTSSAK